MSFKPAEEEDEENIKVEEQEVEDKEVPEGTPRGRRRSRSVHKLLRLCCS